MKYNLTEWVFWNKVLMVFLFFSFLKYALQKYKIMSHRVDYLIYYYSCWTWHDYVKSQLYFVLKTIGHVSYIWLKFHIYMCGRIIVLNGDAVAVGVCLNWTDRSKVFLRIKIHQQLQLFGRPNSISWKNRVLQISKNNLEMKACLCVMRYTSQSGKLSNWPSLI